MKANVGKADRAMRILLGTLLIAAGFYFDKWFWAAGLVLLITGLFRWCLFYKLFGISTCERS